jgi:hypothetical protein
MVSPLARRSLMMDYKDLGGPKALSARLMPELQEKTRKPCKVGGVRATATYMRGVSTTLPRVQQSGGINICAQVACRHPEITGRNAGTSWCTPSSKRIKQ